MRPGEGNSPDRSEASEFGLAWNGKAVKARGLAVFFILAVLALIASQLYAGYRVETALLRAFDAGSAQHTTITVSQNRTSCIVSMSPEVREAFRASYVPGAFKKFCPWVTDD